MTPTLTVSPSNALIDVPRRILVSGLAAGVRVLLRSRTVRGPSVVWTSSARFLADGDGTVDLWRDAPIEGSYEGVS
ncbi:MAG: acyl-CoA thioesterase/BAAT N-terminal domain-containing protein, partial [Burkholderiaceae bacterium]